MGETKDDVKLSCRNLWKVYKSSAAPYFKSEVGKTGVKELSERMREDGAIPAAADVNFDVHVGEIFVIMGLSGSGKSTVVRCLSRLIEATHGEVVLKPLGGRAGQGVIRSSGEAPGLGALLELVTQQQQLPVMIQAALPPVSEGDKRI